MKVCKRIQILLFFSIVGLSPLLYAQDFEGFTDIRELQKKSGELVKPDFNERKWFEPGSNYGKLFIEPQARKNVINWLGSLTSEYKPQDYYEFGNRSFIGVKADYKSKRTLDAPIKLEVLLLHPRAKSSRELKLIPEFNEREARTKNAAHHEQIKIRDLVADLGYNPELEQCSISVQLPKQSLLYLETTKCHEGKQLVQFSESIDIQRLIEKLEH
jgi:hypothetical protein